MIVSFWWRDSGRQGSMNPRVQNAKNASPGTSAAVPNAAQTSAATVDLPAPGGPVTTMGSVTSADDRTVRPRRAGASRRPQRPPSVVPQDGDRQHGRDQGFQQRQHRGRTPGGRPGPGVNSGYAGEPRSRPRGASASAPTRELTPVTARAGPTGMPSVRSAVVAAGPLRGSRAARSATARPPGTRLTSAARRPRRRARTAGSPRPASARTRRSCTRQRPRSRTGRSR